MNSLLLRCEVERCTREYGTITVDVLISNGRPALSEVFHCNMNDFAKPSHFSIASSERLHDPHFYERFREIVDSNETVSAKQNTKWDELVVESRHQNLT